MDIHSQHQTYHHSYSHNHHINLLDSYGKDDYGSLLNSYKEKFKAYEELQKQLVEAKSSANATESQIEFLKFQTEEIEQAEIKENEEEELNSELDILSNLENLKELTYGAYYSFKIMMIHRFWML